METVLAVLVSVNCFVGILNLYLTARQMRGY
jgi:hypothetical protein